MNYKLKESQIKWDSFVESVKGVFDDFFYQKHLKSCRVIGVDDQKVFVFVPSIYTEKILLEQINRDQIIPNREIIFQTKITPDYEEKPPETSQFTFENLIIGKFNEDVIKAVKETLQGKNWGPIFVYSEPGLGKTHILKAICHEGAKNKKQVRYIDANEFGALISEKFSEKNINQIELLKKSFQNNDIILFDDIQLLACRDKTNEILFQIFCKAIDGKKQIIFSSDQHPEELNGFEKRLKSRFLNGLTLEIFYPDYDNALKIVQKKFEQLFPEEIIVDQEVIDFIAKNKTFNRDIRKIEGVVKKLAFNISKFHNKHLNFEKFENLFADQKWLFNNKISPNKIKKTVSKYYQVNFKAMVEGSRESTVVKARSVSMYLMRKLTNLNYSQIAAQFNTKNHTTALNAIKKIKTQIKKISNLKQEVNYLEKTIKEN